MTTQRLRRSYVLVGLLLITVMPAIAIISSCSGPAPTATPAPPTAVPPTLATAPPPADTAVPPTEPPPTAPPPTAPPPTAAPAAPVVKGNPLATFNTADFAGSGMCVVCHALLTDTAGNDVSIDKQWRSVMMANAAHDPLFLAKVTSEIVRTPALQAAIEEKCSHCHMPMAFTQAKVDGTVRAIFGDGFANTSNALHQAAYDGVSCTVCHQIEKQDLGTPASFSGGFTIDTSTDPPDRKAYGPFPEPFADTMRRVTGFTPQPGLQTLNAALCATCHTLYTPYLDAAGNIAGEFPEQTAFLEWQHSAYPSVGQSCEKCHMPEAQGEVVISNAPKPPQIQGRQPFAQHYFVGGNAFVISLFKQNVEKLELTCSTDHLDGTLQRVLNQLQHNTLALSVTEAQTSGGTLTVRLQLDNKAGHKLPTGFPSRRAWIHLVVEDSNGQVIFESGKAQPDGSIVGADSDADAAACEPHYDVIMAPDQVQIYESVMQDQAKKVTYTVLGGHTYVKDNRLLPNGFDKATAGTDFAVQGAAMTDANFLGGGDQVTYQISTQGKSGPYAVTAEVLYESVSYRFAQDLARDDTDLVKEYMAMHDAADLTPVVLASVQQTVP
jgi:hypothetical protein